MAWSALHPPTDDVATPRQRAMIEANARAEAESDAWLRSEQLCLEAQLQRDRPSGAMRAWGIWALVGALTVALVGVGAMSLRARRAAEQAAAERAAAQEARHAAQMESIFTDLESIGARQARLQRERAALLEELERTRGDEDRPAAVQAQPAPSEPERKVGKSRPRPRSTKRPRPRPRTDRPRETEPSPRTRPRIDLSATDDPIGGLSQSGR